MERKKNYGAVVGYALLGLVVVAIAFTSDVRFRQQKHGAVSSLATKNSIVFQANPLTVKGREMERALSLLEFGVLAGVNVSMNVTDDDVNPYSENTKGDSSFPSWMPKPLRNVWVFLTVILLGTIALALLYLGPARIGKMLRGWGVWVETADDVMSGILFPTFFVEAGAGLFAVIQPILVLRTLQLDAVFLACIIFAEHVLQILMQSMVGPYVGRVGLRQGMNMVGVLHLVGGGMVFLLALIPSSTVISNRWVVFAYLLISKLVLAEGAQVLAVCTGTAFFNPAFLPPSKAQKTWEVHGAIRLLGAVTGALTMGLLFTMNVPIEYSFFLPLVVYCMLYLAVSGISDSMFPINPASLRPAPGIEAPTWMYPIWSHEVARWHLLQYLTIFLALSTLQISFPFLIPLDGMRFGLEVRLSLSVCLCVCGRHALWATGAISVCVCLAHLPYICIHTHTHRLPPPLFRWRRFPLAYTHIHTHEHE